VHDRAEVADRLALEDPERHHLKVVHERRDGRRDGAAVTQLVTVPGPLFDDAVRAEQRPWGHLRAVTQGGVRRVDPAVDDDDAPRRHSSSTT
jgi:hypothetical protein